MPLLEIRLLGEIEVRRDQRILSFPTQKTKELFVYLVTFRDRAHPRSILAGLLFPASDEQKARANLRQVLSRLRRVLEGKLNTHCTPWLEANGSTVRFHMTVDDCWLDVEEFERLLNASTEGKSLEPLEQAMALYRGPFSPGIYEDWVLAEVERLQTLYVDALDQLATAYQTRLDYKKAIDTWRKALEVIPWHERAHRELMTLYATVGDRASALRQYNDYTTILQRELNAPPLAETRALYERLLQGAPLPAAPVQRVTTQLEMPFVGRARECERLKALWENACRDWGALVLIAGEIGVGKTSLVRHWMGQIQREATILEGATHPLGSNLPYQPLLMAVREGLKQLSSSELTSLPSLWRREIAQFIPEIQTQISDFTPNPELLPAQGKARRFAALTEFFKLLASKRPVSLFLDDLHWADQTTLEYLSDLSVQLKDLRLLVIGTYREEEAPEQSYLRHWLDKMGASRLYELLKLPRLSREETGLVLSQLLNWQDERAFQILYNETEGNPFFLRELVRSLIQRAVLSPDEEGRWKLVSPDIDPTQFPESLRELIHASLRRVPHQAQSLLSLASVIGREFELRVLERILRWPEEKLLNRLDDLRRAGLIVEREGRYGFDHEMIRQGIYAELSADRKRLWHRRVGEVLEELHQDRVDEIAGELAKHFEHAQVWEKAMIYAIQAGTQAQRVYAYGEAIHFLSKARQFFEKWESERPLSLRWKRRKLDLLAQYTGKNVFPMTDDIIPFLGEVKTAVSDMVAVAQDVGDDLRLCEAYQRQARIQLAQGEREAARETLRRALEISGKITNPLLAEVLVDIGYLHTQMGEYPQGLDDYRRAAESAATQGNADVHVRALYNVAVTQFLLGQLEEAHRNMKEAYRLCQPPVSLRVQASVLNNLGLILYEMRQWQEAQSCYEQAYQVMSEIGNQRAAGISLINLGTLFTERRNYQVALGYFDRVIALVNTPGMKGLEMEALSEKGHAHLGRGELAKALDCSERAIRLLDAQQGIATEAQRFYFTHYQILRENGRLEEARVYLQRAYEELGRVAEEIHDESLRKSFLENVSINRKILQAWQELRKPSL